MMVGLTGGGVGGTAPPPIDLLEAAELGRECDVCDLEPPRKFSS